MQPDPPAFTPSYKSSVLRSPLKALIAFDNTLSELTGPVFGHAMLGELDNDLIHNFARPGESAMGERIIVHGRVLEERGKGVPGVLLEFWQANAGGRYRHCGRKRSPFVVTHGRTAFEIRSDQKRQLGFRL